MLSEQGQRVEVIGDAAVFAELAPAWAELWQAAAPTCPSPALRHGYVNIGLRHAAPRSVPCVIVVWRDARLICAWPLVVRREAGARVARHSGCGNDEEYGGPLIAADVDAAAVLASIWPLLEAVADAVCACNLLPHGVAAIALAQSGRARATQAVMSPIIRCGQFADVAAWRHSQSKKKRAQIGNDRRRLAKQGRLETVMVAPAEAAAFCDWFFATKCLWLDARGIGDNWLRWSHCQTFFVDALRNPAETGVFALALMLDGAYVAGSLCLDGDVIEYFATTFDRSLARYSPGSLNFEDLLAIGAATGRDVDLRITAESYKLRWADDGEARVTLLIALTPRGLVPVCRAAARRRLVALRRRLGAVRRRWRA
jgi:CelD/BcsL family acetyltransferase involved in cellulose biosynthesis